MVQPELVGQCTALRNRVQRRIISYAICRLRSSLAGSQRLVCGINAANRRRKTKARPGVSKGGLMKLANFDVGGHSEIGLVDGTRIISLTRALPRLPVTMVELIAQWEAVRPAIGELNLASAPSFPLAEVVLRAPIDRPGKVMAIGMNYADHRGGSGCAATGASGLVQQDGQQRSCAVRADQAASGVGHRRLRGGTRLHHRDSRTIHLQGSSASTRLRLLRRQ